MCRSCGYYDARFYHNSSQLQRIRWYRVPPNTPAVPFPHAFGHPQYDGDLIDWPNPIDGQIGIKTPERGYSRGAPPLGLPLASPNVCGTPEQWLDGSDINDPNAPLTWTPLGFSLCCLRWPTDLSALVDTGISGDMNVEYHPSENGNLTCSIGGDMQIGFSILAPADLLISIGGDMQIYWIRPAFPDLSLSIGGSVSLEFVPPAGSNLSPSIGGDLQLEYVPGFHWPAQVLVQFSVSDNACDCSPYRDGFYLDLTIDHPTNPYWEAVNPLGSGVPCGVTVFLTLNTLAPHAALNCSDAVVYSDNVSWDGVSALVLTTRAGGPGGFVCTGYPASVTLYPA